jgi:hypothetical protein
MTEPTPPKRTIAMMVTLAPSRLQSLCAILRFTRRGPGRERQTVLWPPLSQRSNFGIIPLCHVTTALVMGTPRRVGRTRSWLRSYSMHWAVRSPLSTSGQARVIRAARPLCSRRGAE